MPNDLVEKIDQKAAEMYLSRSAFIRVACTELIEK